MNKYFGLRCPSCGKVHVIKITLPIPKISLFSCDLCKKNIPLEYDQDSDKFSRPKFFRMTDVKKLEMERVM